MGPAKKLLLLTLSAIGVGVAWVKFGPGRLLTADQVEALAPGAAALANNPPPPHALTVGTQILLPLATFGGFELVHAVVTSADPTASIGYATARATNGRNYKLSTVEESEAYFDPADGNVQAWADAHHAHMVA